MSKFEEQNQPDLEQELRQRELTPELEEIIKLMDGLVSEGWQMHKIIDSEGTPEIIMKQGEEEKYCRILYGSQGAETVPWSKTTETEE